MVSKNKERKLEREILWIIGFMAFLVLLFFITSAVFKSLGKVEYEGLTFTKEKYGELYFYKASYYFRDPSGNLINYDLFVRTNPLENKVPIMGNSIDFVGRQAYVTLDTSYLRECDQTEVAIPDLVRFLTDNRISVSSGNMDYVEAAVHGQEHVTCENKPGMDVIQLRRGNQTQISVDGTCSDIQIGEDCQVLEAVEKYKIHAFLDAQRQR